MKTRRITRLVISGAVFLAIKGCIFSKVKTAPAGSSTNLIQTPTVYDIGLKTLDGTGNINLADYKGQKILIVNTASECGYTAQYEGLEKLYQANKGRLMILGCPCNQFGGQEPGDTAAIFAFCKKNFGITFPLSEKLDVRGSGQHPLYDWLSHKAKNGVLDAEVTWNFNKFLISETGQLMAYFPSKVKPQDSVMLAAIAQ